MGASMGELHESKKMFREDNVGSVWTLEKLTISNIF